ncbi:hypothetical protein GPJ56_004784 [Histomonas meleagridis]|uniref:uncharacterized protein n=1 Tax=Histomonas meleagridis TaxID=135588 RepID=UPI003559629D|nr:hypothetical protein GPJ56_004784 [Histomonas meleagridis]KAH0801682.1 hypothetical protein GO595_005517 [Histomonas meleagridis]
MNVDDLSKLSSDILNTSDLSPDAYALAKVIQELLPLFKENAELYSDMRKKLVNHYLNQPSLEIEKSFSFELTDKIAEETPKPDNSKLKDQLLKLAKQLSQFNQQSIETKAQTEKTIEQLDKEISDLKDQVKNYQMLIERLSRPNSEMPTPARVSSKSSESSLFQSTSTPKRRSYTPRISPSSGQRVMFSMPN